MGDFHFPILGMQRATQEIRNISERLSSPSWISRGQPRFGGDTFARQAEEGLVPNLIKLNMAQLLFNINATVFGMMKRMWDEFLNIMRSAS